MYPAWLQLLNVTQWIGITVTNKWYVQPTWFFYTVWCEWHIFLWQAITHEEKEGYYVSCPHLGHGARCTR